MGHNFKELLGEAKKLSPGARIIGCTCAGVIGREGPNETMKALAIMAIKGAKREFTLACCKSIENEQAYAKGVRIAEDLKSENPDINMILFIPSVLPMSPFDEAIKGIESVFGSAMPIFGGASVDNMKGINVYAFLDGEVVEKGWIAIGFSDLSLKVITQVNHGFNVLTGMQMEVTRAVSNAIYELNGKPAWNFITHALGVPDTADPMEVLTLGIMAEELPSEFEQEYGSNYILRSQLGNPADGSIVLPVACREGTKLLLAKRDEKRMFDGVDGMTRKILEDLDGAKPVAVFHADCLLRGRFSINRILKDEFINRMQYPLCQGEPVPWFGLYSGGEIAMIGGRNWFHTFTSALSVFYR
jgi:hypothetical protein